MNETKWIISGYSHDLIYVEAIHGDSTEADTQGEIDAYGTTATIETTTGWKFNFTYAPPGCCAFWKFDEVESGGGPSPEIIEATDEDDDYSDNLTVSAAGLVVTVKGVRHEFGEVTP